MSCVSKDTVKKPKDPTKRVKPFVSSILSWVASDDAQLQHAESLVLRPIAGSYIQKTIAGLNTICSLPHEDKSRPTVVLLHGFAGGIGMWIQNWNAIVEVANVYALDLPGYGRSPRDDIEFETPEQVMSYFFKYLDSWFNEMGIDYPVVMAGHSFGAYIAAHYCTKRKGRICHLLMADPWGVPHMPEEVEKKVSLKWRMMTAIMYVVSPLSVIRAAGPWGPKILRRARPDFANRWANVLGDPKVFYDYTYHINAKSPANGESALRACSQGPAYAKIPLMSFLCEELPENVAISLLHGCDTWTDVDGHTDLIAKFRSLGKELVELHSIPNAGHQLNTDNAPVFNKVFVEVVTKMHRLTTATAMNEGSSTTSPQTKEDGCEAAQSAHEPTTTD